MGPWVLWLISAIVMIIIEMMTSTFYFLWLGIASGVAAFIAFLFPDLIWLQLVVASVIAIMLSLVTPKLTKSFHKRSPGYKDNKYDLVGKRAVVITPIHPNDYGVVRVVGHGEWTAITKKPYMITEGSEVIIEEVNGLILTVTTSDVQSSNQGTSDVDSTS